MVIFLWLFVITFLRKRDTPNNKFLDVTNKETDSHVALLLKSTYYELGAINLYLEGAAIIVSTIC